MSDTLFGVDFSKREGETEPAKWVQVLLSLFLGSAFMFSLVLFMNPENYEFFIKLLK